MEEHQPVPEFDPATNQPSQRQWIVIAVIGFVAICGVLLFLSGGALTAFSWFNEQQTQATNTAVAAQTQANATAAAATAVAFERDQALRAAAQWPEVIFDTFDDNRNEWITGEIDDDYATIQVSIDDVYQWDATAKQGFAWRVWPQSDLTADFYLAVDAQNTGENNEAQYGLVFHNNTAGYFYWEISDTQYFRFYSYTDDWVELIPSTYTAALQPGALNHLVVISEDGRYKFWINDQFVGEAPGSSPTQGQAGVAIGLSYEGDESIIIFDNFELRALSTVE